MKRLLWMICALSLVLWIACAQGESLVYPDTDFQASADAEAIDFGETQVALDQLIPYLSQFPGLKRVDMFASPVNADGIEKLTEAFPEIEFGWTINFADHQIRTDCTAFSTLHTRDSHTHVSEEFSVLRYCRQLRALDFGHNAVVDISWIAELPELRVLIIACNQVEDISPIGTLSKLEYLEMFTNRIRDITPLLNCPNLMDLNIGYNWIDDLTPLQQMTQLKRLWMYNYNHTGVPTRTVINTIMEWLPDVQLNTASSPTEGGWRKHPHFDVIHAMFRSPDGYEPFEDSVPDGKTLKDPPTVRDED